MKLFDSYGITTESLEYPWVIISDIGGFHLGTVEFQSLKRQRDANLAVTFVTSGDKVGTMTTESCHDTNIVITGDTNDDMELWQLLIVRVPTLSPLVTKVMIKLASWHLRLSQYHLCHYWWHQWWKGWHYDNSLKFLWCTLIYRPSQARHVVSNANIPKIHYVEMHPFMCCWYGWWL